MKRLFNTKIYGLFFALTILLAGITDAQAQSNRTGNASPNATGQAAKPVNKRKIVVEKPDLKKIQEETLNPQSPFYYPNLLKKYNRNDTVMTNEEFRYLYLGYMFQEDYDPYRTSPYSSMTDKYRSKKNLTKEEIDTIRMYAEKTLNDNPFDLQQMSFLVHVLKERGKHMSSKIWEFRLEHLLGAIKSTGTGESQENAWYVIYPMHEYDMVQLLGYEATNADYFDPGIDYLTVKAKPETEKKLKNKVAKGFYFNVEVPQSQYEMKHPEPDEEDIEIVQGEEVEEPFDPDDAPAE